MSFYHLQDAEIDIKKLSMNEILKRSEREHYEELKNCCV